MSLDNSLKSKVQIPRSSSVTYGITEHLRKLYSKAGVKGISLTFEPGDFQHIGHTDLSISAPIAVDVWYLWKTKSITADDKAASKKYIEERLGFLLSKLNISVLRKIRNRSDIVSFKSEYASRTKEFFFNTGIYYIHEMRFELRIKGKELLYNSKGLKDKNMSDYIGFLSFPVGQLGVMAVLSMITESMTEKTGFALKDNEKTVVGLKFFPPIDRPGNNCMGTHLVENGYKLCEGVEHSASDIGDKINPHLWLRYWIKKDCTKFVPGDFIGLACKPVVKPPHVWWFQVSFPFLAAGNWFESEYYTSGVIISIDDDADGIGKKYKIKVKGIEIYLKPTDFCKYNVGDRVAIVKKISASDSNFTWAKILADRVKDTRYTDITIIPIIFFKEA